MPQLNSSSTDDGPVPSELDLHEHYPKKASEEAQMESRMCKLLTYTSFIPSRSCRKAHVQLGMCRQPKPACTVGSKLPEWALSERPLSPTTAKSPWQHMDFTATRSANEIIRSEIFKALPLLWVMRLCSSPEKKGRRRAGKAPSLPTAWSLAVKPSKKQLSPASTRGGPS